MIATFGVMVGKKSQSSPANSTRETIGSAAALRFIAQPSRLGSTNVSMPTLVKTPGRLAAASRWMSNRMPLGTLYAGIASSEIIRQIRGGSADDGPDGYEPASTRLRQP